MRSLLICLMLFTSVVVNAHVTSDGEDCDHEQPGKKLIDAVKKTAQEPGCPNAKKVKNLCLWIDSRTEEDASSKYKYKYQKQIMEASCVEESDSENVRVEKVRKMWAQLETQLVCNNLQFDIPNGNVLKFASAKMFDAFLHDAIKWKVNLNKVDETDGNTVLDYIRSTMDRKKGSETAKQLEYYYRLLREAGAKHKTEL